MTCAYYFTKLKFSNRKKKLAIHQILTPLKSPTIQHTVYSVILLSFSLSLFRHDVYLNQFRAMFVLNCKIVKDEILHYKTKLDKRKRGGRVDRQERDGGSASASGAGKDEVYYPVKCSVCDTEVAVLDNEQVFHFFNVLASPP